MRSLYIIKSFITKVSLLFDTNHLVNMAQRQGMFAAFVDDDEDRSAQVAPKTAAKKPAQVKTVAAKTEERVLTVKPNR